MSGETSSAGAESDQQDVVESEGQDQAQRHQEPQSNQEASESENESDSVESCKIAGDDIAPPPEPK